MLLWNINVACWYEKGRNIVAINLSSLFIILIGPVKMRDVFLEAVVCIVILCVGR